MVSVDSCSSRKTLCAVDTRIAVDTVVFDQVDGTCSSGRELILQVENICLLLLVGDMSLVFVVEVGLSISFRPFSEWRRCNACFSSCKFEKIGGVGVSPNGLRLS